MVTTRGSSARNQSEISTLYEAAALAFDQAEAAGSTVQEATTAAQEAVSRAVTGEGTGVTTPPVVDPEPPARTDQASEDEDYPDEEPPAAAQDIDIQDTLSEDLQLAAVPTTEEGDEEGFIEAENVLDQTSPTDMVGEDHRNWTDDESDLVAASRGPFSLTPIGGDDIDIERP